MGEKGNNEYNTFASDTSISKYNWINCRNVKELPNENNDSKAKNCDNYLDESRDSCCNIDLIIHDNDGRIKKMMQYQKK